MNGWKMLLVLLRLINHIMFITLQYYFTEHSNDTISVVNKIKRKKENHSLCNHSKPEIGFSKSF